jgi:hypothetical protein
MQSGRTTPRGDMNDLSFRLLLSLCCCVAMASSFFFSPLSFSLSLSGLPSLFRAHHSLTKPSTPPSIKTQAVAAPAKNVAAKFAAVAAAVLISAAPVFAAEDAVKNAVCARTPTAKMCLRDSVKR